VGKLIQKMKTAREAGGIIQPAIGQEGSVAPTEAHYNLQLALWLPLYRPLCGLNFITELETHS
jgi:hypothetical protein